jgi:hypothetical protein
MPRPSLAALLIVSSGAFGSEGNDMTYSHVAMVTPFTLSSQLVVDFVGLSARVRDRPPIFTLYQQHFIFQTSNIIPFSSILKVQE